MISRLRSINFPILFKVIGWLLMIEAIFMILPIITAIIYHETNVTAFIISFAITLGAGLLFSFGIRPSKDNMGKHEAFLLTAITWIFFAIFGMIPFIIGSSHLSIIDAFFESMSGFTTTGTSVMGDVNTIPNSITLWRCVMQWIGGMGIILFTLAVTPMLNHSGGMQMFNAEVTGITREKLRPRISQTAKGMWGVYFFLTILLMILLSLGPMNIFESICHAFAGISTGGFTASEKNIHEWNSSYTEIVMIIFMFFGGTNFALLYRAAHGDFKSMLRNNVFRSYLRLIAIFYILFAISIFIHNQATTIKSLTLDPLFQVVSLITSTGYLAPNFYQWGSFIFTLSLMMMFFGGCAGSTSGGAKIDRAILFQRNLRNELYRCLRPNSVLSVRIGNNSLPQPVVSKGMAFLAIYVMLIFIGALLLTIVGIPMSEAMFSSLSCACNTGIGPTLDPATTYATLPAFAKCVLASLMLIGRLEIFTILVIFTPGFWKS